MKTYIVRTTLFEVDGQSEEPIAQAEASDFDGIEEAADEFLERIGDEDGEIDEYLLCPVQELQAMAVEDGDDAA